MNGFRSGVGDSTGVANGWPLHQSTIPRTALLTLLQKIDTEPLRFLARVKKKEKERKNWLLEAKRQRGAAWKRVILNGSCIMHHVGSAHAKNPRDNTEYNDESRNYLAPPVAHCVRYYAVTSYFVIQFFGPGTQMMLARYRDLARLLN